MMTWARRELAVAGFAQLVAERLLADRDPELVPNPLRQVDQAPAHDAVRGRNRSSLDGPEKRETLLGTQQRFGARRFAVGQTISTALVEPHYPVAYNLETDTTNARRLAAAMSVVDRSQSQKSPYLPTVSARPCYNCLRSGLHFGKIALGF